MKRRHEEEPWKLFLSLKQLLASLDPRTHRLLVVHAASCPGTREPLPALIEVDERGVVTLIKRIRDAG